MQIMSISARIRVLHTLAWCLVGCSLISRMVLAESPSDTNAWTQFRGNNGLARVDTCHVPIPWGDGDVCWAIDLPGKGNGSPVVFGSKVFLMSADANSAERYVLAYDLLTGKEVWRRTFPSEPHHLHARSSYASGTPCVNEQAVFFSWASPQSVVLKAFTHDGEEIWSKDLGRFVSQHGFGASPVLFGDKLVLFNSQAAEQLPPGVEPGQSLVMAFDAATGKTLWQQPLETTRVCYGVPVRFQDQSGADAILLSDTAAGIVALNLETGSPLWNKPVFTKRTVSCPVIVGDLAIGTEGSGGGGNILFAVSLKGDHEIEFKIDRAAPYVPTPVAKDNLLFLWSDNGIVTCLKLPGHEIAWSKRIGGNVSTSPIIAGDKLIGIAEDGTLTALAASESFEELGSLKLGDTTRATPLVSENYLLVRTDSKLMCIGKPQPLAP